MPSDLAQVQADLLGELTDSEKLVVRRIVEHHKKCFGRGFIGWTGVDKRLVLCTCVNKAWAKIVIARVKLKAEAEKAEKEKAPVG